VLATRSSSESKIRRLSAAFNLKFRGSAVDSFLLALREYKEMYDSQFHYGRVISIVQSSATGKSRLVEALKDHVVTLIPF
jgi:6-phosphogluconate dehydrogenase (decarboxylating)